MVTVVTIIILKSNVVIIVVKFTTIVCTKGLLISHDFLKNAVKFSLFWFCTQNDGL
jgi:hypothetical protein